MLRPAPHVQPAGLSSLYRVWSPSGAGRASPRWPPFPPRA